MLEPEHDFVGRTERIHDLADPFAVAELTDRASCEIVVAPIPVVKKKKLEMHPAGRNNPCGAKEQERDADQFRFVFL